MLTVTEVCRSAAVGARWRPAHPDGRKRRPPPRPAQLLPEPTENKRLTLFQAAWMYPNESLPLGPTPAPRGSPSRPPLPSPRRGGGRGGAARLSQRPRRPSRSDAVGPCRPAVASGKMAASRELRKRRRARAAAPLTGGAGRHGSGERRRRPAGPEPPRAAGDAEAAGAAAGGPVRRGGAQAPRSGSGLPPASPVPA